MANDALGQVMLEVNTLAETLRSQRLGAQEATALLRAVMAEIDVAIFAFDSDSGWCWSIGRRTAARARTRRLDRPARRRPGLQHVARQPLHDSGSQLPRRRRPVGDPAHDVLAGRLAARAGGAVRPLAAAARAGAPGVAPADSRHRPRVEQLAGPDQVDRRQPRVAAQHASVRPTTGATTCAWARRHRIARRRARAGSPPPTPGSRGCRRRSRAAGRIRCR